MRLSQLAITMFCGLIALAACDSESPDEVPSSPAPPDRPSADRLAAGLGSVLVIGGGADPASTQISLAQDVRLARDTFVHLGAEPSVLFGSGDASLVQRTEPTDDDSLRASLATFFDPRERDVRYESFDVRAAGPADADMVLSLLTSLPTRQEPRFFFIAGHGERGEEPWDAIVRLWGDIPVSVPEFSEALGETPARVVVTSCYGGGFANVLFRDGRPPDATMTSGDLVPDRCGFFATTWDREASGCDPNPERGQQEGYAMHFFHALEGRDRAGDETNVDFDGDGVLTMLEAHTHARIADRSFDVPSTTSEFFLRLVAPKLDAVPADEEEDEDTDAEDAESDGTPDVVHAPEAEEAAVIAALRAELEVDDAAAARALVETLQDGIVEHEGTHAVLQERADYAYYALRIRLLERWPILDDPWHVDHAHVLARDSAAIEEVLRASVEARELGEAFEDQERSEEGYDTLQVQLARALVLDRAYETVALTATLRAQGGELWESYQALRACERVPATAFRTE